jgi:hypothetical protein
LHVANDKVNSLLLGVANHISAEYIKQGVGLANDRAPAMNQALVLIGWAQWKGLSDLVLELFDRSAGSKIGKQQGSGHANRR